MIESQDKILILVIPFFVGISTAILFAYCLNYIVDRPEREAAKKKKHLS